MLRWKKVIDPARLARRILQLLHPNISCFRHEALETTPAPPTPSLFFGQKKGDLSSSARLLVVGFFSNYSASFSAYYQASLRGIGTSFAAVFNGILSLQASVGLESSSVGSGKAHP
ncbi:unnamed protein product [Caenorhabditis auriculariae]|uniref:Uncharacterized protein n=1 Tax=Caenorhabditis auriculariae TaxID=2777116 RepID=A0A8S1HVR1_9PELO|nr:unnamed protein product [Caenorhabditis auriculariae]